MVMLLASLSCYTEIMQEDDKSPEWQQPAPTNSGAPYQSVSEESPSSSPESTESATESTPAPSSEAPSTSEVETDAVIQWQATEYLQHDRSATWFIVLGIITLALMAVAIFWMQSISFAILIPVMAAALVMYVKRPPALISYTVSRKGIHINDKLHTYEEFRSFGVLSHEGNHSVVLVPRKRFQLSQTVYFPEEIGEDLVDMLAARLPMNEVKPDAIDRFLARMRL